MQTLIPALVPGDLEPSTTRLVWRGDDGIREGVHQYLQNSHSKQSHNTQQAPPKRTLFSTWNMCFGIARLRRRLCRSPQPDWQRRRTGWTTVPFDLGGKKCVHHRHTNCPSPKLQNGDRILGCRLGPLPGPLPQGRHRARSGLHLGCSLGTLPGPLLGSLPGSLPLPRLIAQHPEHEPDQLGGSSSTCRPVQLLLYVLTVLYHTSLQHQRAHDNAA